MDTNKVFVWENEVYDTEIDFQGIVNNAHYFSYMAITRHKHLSALGIDIVNMHQYGFELMLTKSEIAFKDSLKYGDEYIVTSELEPSGRIRFAFKQQILRKSDQKVMIDAVNVGVCIDRSTGKPIIPEQLQFIFDKSK